MTPPSALVFEPHNDDFVIGIGGTGLQLLDAGWEITSVVLTDGRLGSIDLTPEETRRVRLAEKEREAEALGIDVVGLDYRDQSLASRYEDETRREEVLADLREVVETVDPAVVFVPASTEGHPDHRATNRFARDLFDDLPRDVAVVEYVIHEIPFLAPVSTTPNTVVAVDVERTFEEKLAAIRHHESQLEVFAYDDLVATFDEFLGHLYTHELTGSVAEVLHLEHGEGPSRFFEDTDAVEVTDKFHGSLSATDD